MALRAERLLRLVVVITSGTLLSTLVWTLMASTQRNIVAFIGSFLVGAFVGDLISGFVHLFLDHFRNYDSPFGGVNAFEFQMHHVDQLRAARICDPLDDLGMTGILGIPVASAALFLPIDSSLFMWTLGSSAAWIVVFGMTSQTVHMWIHDRDRTPRFLKALQRTGLIISHDYHARHHLPPFNTRFSIVTGWANPLIEATGMPALFFHVLSGGKGPDPDALLAFAAKRNMPLTRAEAEWLRDRSVPGV